MFLSASFPRWFLLDFHSLVRGGKVRRGGLLDDGVGALTTKPFSLPFQLSLSSSAATLGSACMIHCSSSFGGSWGSLATIGMSGVHSDPFTMFLLTATMVSGMISGDIRISAR